MGRATSKLNLKLLPKIHFYTKLVLNCAEGGGSSVEVHDFFELNMFDDNKRTDRC